MSRLITLQISLRHVGYGGKIGGKNISETLGRKNFGEKTKQN